MRRKTLTIVVISVALILSLVGIYFASKFQVLPQSAYHLLEPMPSVKPTDRLLVVTPHPDDETIGAGGLIQQAVSAGAEVKIVVATDGNKHGLRDTRYQEITTAVGDLGVKPANITFFGYPDGNLAAQTEFKQKLSDFIAQYHPTTVITTLPQDLHPDHAACGQAVQDLKKAGGTFTAEYFLTHYHRYPRPIGYEPDEYLLPPVALLGADYDWQRLALTNTQETTKEKAIREYKSQLSPINPVLPQLLLSFTRQNELFATEL